MAELYLPGATRMLIGNTAPTDGGPPKAIAHITWDRNASASAPQDLVPYESLQTWFGVNPDGKQSAPHILWDPFTGRFTQFFPANSRSLSLADGSGGTRTNRAGSVVLQIEALFFPYCRVDGKVYAKLTDTPMKGWSTLLAWIRGWGVPNLWPNGTPESCTRNESTWATKGGWYPHKAVPENDHTDPGSWPSITINTSDPTPPENTMEPVDVWAYKTTGETKDAYWFQRDTNALAFQARAAAQEAVGGTSSANHKLDNVHAKLDNMQAKLDTITVKLNEVLAILNSGGTA
jgi:hypothetical protein